MDNGRLGPGLARARAKNLVAHKQVSLFRTHDATLGRWLASADVVSEGSIRPEREGDVWFGSTSLRVATGEVPRADARVLSADLHLRTRVLRIASREARLRAPGALGPIRCEIRVEVVDGGLRIDVDVQAPLIEGHGRAVVLPKDPSRTR